MKTKNKICVAKNVSNIYEVLVEDGNSKDSVDLINDVETEIEKINQGKETKYQHLYNLIDDLLELEGDVEYIVREVKEMLDSIKHAEKITRKSKDIKKVKELNK